MRLFFTVIAITYLSISSVYANDIAIQPINSKTSSATKSALASKSLLLDIFAISADKLVAVGQHGHILLSSDGETWQQANVPVKATLTKVFFLNEKLGWAVGHDATILISQDGGLNWQLQQYLPSLEKPLLDIYFKNAQQGIAVGAYGQFFRSNDGGASWQSEFHQAFLLEDDIEYLDELRLEDEAAYLDEISFILPHFNSVVAEGNNIFLIGETGLIAKSIDFGITWQPIENFYQGSFFSLARIKNDGVIIAGLRGHVFRNVPNTQEALHWRQVETGTTALLNDIVLTDDGRIFILGNNGVLLMSTDDGKSFKLFSQQDGKALIAGVWFKEKLIAVSDVGIKVIKGQTLALN